MGHIKFTGAMILTGLFVISVVAFVVTFASQNNTAFTVDGQITGLNDSVSGRLTTWSTDINGTSKSLTQSEIKIGETLQTGTQLRGGQDSGLGVFKDTLSTSFDKLFGAGSGFGVLFTALFGFLIFIGLMYWYKAWIGRNPD